MRLLGLLLLLLAAGCGEQEAPKERAPYTQTIPGTDVSFEMRWIPGTGVWVGATEVTWAEYEAYSLTQDTPEGVDAVTRPTKPYLPPDRGWGTGKRPVVGISRHAAMQYCVWLSKKTGRTYRLPTESEWAAACGGAGGAWHAGNSGEQTQEVGQKEANVHGLFDMRGNVWEYCSGSFAEGDDRPVMRGGCWETPEAECACAARRACPEEWNDSDAQRPRGIWWLADGPYVGFRVAREP